MVIDEDEGQGCNTHVRIPEAARARSAHTHIFIFDVWYFTVRSSLSPKQANARNSFTDRFLKDLFYVFFSFLGMDVVCGSVFFSFASFGLFFTLSTAVHGVRRLVHSFICLLRLRSRLWPRFSIMNVESRHIAIQLCNVRVISSLFYSFFNDVVPFDVSQANAGRTHEHRTHHSTHITMACEHGCM